MDRDQFKNTLREMFEPLGLLGTYQVTGIEGKYFDGYVSGKRLESGVGTDGAGVRWVEDLMNDRPWALEVETLDVSV